MRKTVNPIRIQIVEGIRINEAGLHCLLEGEPDFKILEHIQCDHLCNRTCVRQDPDILLMVMNFGEKCGLECIKQISKQFPLISILVLCMVEDHYIAKRLIDLGVKGIVCGQTPPEILFHAIRKIAKGGTYIDTEIARALATLNKTEETDPFSSLTLREYEVVRLMLDGFNQKEIGKHMFISPHTVANHHSNILKKLNTSNHIELTKLAIRHHVTSL